MQDEQTNKEFLMDEVKKLAKGAVSDLSYETWIAHLEIVSITNNTISFLVINDFYRLQVQGFSQLLNNCFKRVLNTNIDYNIEFITSDELNNMSDNMNIRCTSKF